MGRNQSAYSTLLREQHHTKMTSLFIEFKNAWTTETLAISQQNEAKTGITAEKLARASAIADISSEIAALTQKKIELVNQFPQMEVIKETTEVIKRAREERAKLDKDLQKTIKALSDVPSLSVGHGFCINTNAVLSLAAENRAVEAILALKIHNPAVWKTTIANRKKVKQYLQKQGVWQSLIAHFGSETHLHGFLKLTK